MLTSPVSSVVNVKVKRGKVTSKCVCCQCVCSVPNADWCDDLMFEMAENVGRVKVDGK